MWRFVAGITIGIAIGLLATLAITSQAWLTASMRENMSWDGGREWITATSGWAAAIVGVIGVYLVYGQLQETIKQTRFALGDEDPTIDVIQHLREKERLVVRIVNRNRRAILVKDIVAATKADLKDSQTAIWSVENESGELPGSFPIIIAGWENRSNGPAFARIDLYLIRRKPGTEPGAYSDEAIEFPSDSRITAKIQMLGNKHHNFDLITDALPNV